MTAKRNILRLESDHPDDAQKILFWSKGEKAFYKWSAGVLGDYPITKEQFGFVNNLMAFTAIYDDEVVGFFAMRRPGKSYDEQRFGFVVVDPERRGKGFGKGMLQLGVAYAKEVYKAEKLSLGVFENNESAYHCYKAVGFRDVVLEETETYTVLGEIWNCLELEMQL